MERLKKQIVKPFPIAIVRSCFNQAITDLLCQSALEHLEALHFTDEHLSLIEVPGAIEIPIIAQRLANTHRYEAIITLGAIIRGETTHYDFVCEQVSQGCQRIALDHNIPIIFGVLTTENREQALARIDGTHSHKGIEAVDVAIAMVSLLRQIDAAV